MLYSQITAVLAFATTALAAPSGDVTKRAQTVYLAGDSTMARASGATTGWGVYLPNSLTLNVVNKAIGGRSSRSYTREGRFDEIINAVQANDIVIIEFGHNDGGGLSNDNGRSVCGGSGSETCQTTYNGVAETVHTFSWYLTEAGKKIIAKGGKVIVSSQTPNNPWEGGSYNYGDGGRFVGYARDVAKALGANAMYVDHGGYTAREMQRLGKAATDKLFPSDHTHTSPAGAELVSKTFVKGLICNNSGGFLKGFVKTETNTVPGNCV